MPAMETYRPIMSTKFADAAEPDIELLRRYCAARDREAIATLLARHTDAAYRLALWAANNPSDAEDIVQDAFVDVLSSAHPGINNVREWIMRVVITTAYDAQREAARRRKREEAVSAGVPREESANPESKELAEAALRCARTLPPHYRLPILLHFIEELSIAEVSRALSVPEKTVRSQISRGLEQMRESLAAAGCVTGVGGIPSLLAAAPAPAAPATLAATVKTLALKAAAAPVAAGGIAVAWKIPALLMIVVIAVATLAIVPPRKPLPPTPATNSEEVPIAAEAPPPLDKELAAILDRKISVDHRRSYLKEVLDDLNEQAALKSVYPESIRSVLFTFAMNDVPVGDVLKKLASLGGLVIEFSGRTVVLTKNCGDAGRAAFEKSLQSADARTRAEAVCEMGRTADSRACRGLLKSLGDINASVRMWTVFSLCNFREILPHVATPDETNAAAALLRKEIPASGEYRAAVLKLLGVLSAADEKLMLDSLQGGDIASCESAAEALMRHHSEAALKELAKVLGGGNENVRYSVAEALTGAPPEIVAEPLFDLMSRAALWPPENEAVAALPPDLLFPHIETVLAGKNETARANCPQVLGLVRGSGREKAYRMLLPLLKDTARMVRHNAAVALQNVRDPDSITVLMNRYPEESDPKVKQAIFESLSTKRTPAAMQWVFDHAADFGLAKLNYVAIRAVGQTRDDRAEELLLKQIQDGPHEMKQYIIQGLAEIRSDKSQAQLVEALRSDDDYLRWNATIHLARRRDLRAIDSLLGFLNNAPQKWMPDCAAGVARWYFSAAPLKDREKVHKALNEYAEMRNQPAVLPPATGDF